MAEITFELLVGRNVRSLRQKLGLTQAELGQRLGGASASRPQSSVAALEAGRRRVSVPDLLALADALGVPPQALLATPGVGAARIRAGRRVLRSGEWNEHWRITDGDIAALLPARGLSPEMRRLFRDEDRLSRDALLGREKALARRKKFPGPTFVSDGDRTLSFGIPGIPREVTLSLEGGVPYVARDAAEARALERAVLRGRARRIDRFEARRLREARTARIGKSSGRAKPPDHGGRKQPE